MVTTIGKGKKSCTAAIGGDHAGPRPATGGADDQTWDDWWGHSSFLREAEIGGKDLLRLEGEAALDNAPRGET
jgi:hypothetical protein